MPMIPGSPWSLDPTRADRRCSCWRSCTGWAGAAPGDRGRSPPRLGRLALFAGGLIAILAALVSPHRPPRRAADGDAHGPAHPAARHRPDPADPRADQGAAAAGHPAAADDRATRRVPRPSGVRGDRLRRVHVAVAHPGDVRPGPAPRRASTCSSTSASSPPARSTGGTCCRRSAAACASAGMGPVALHGRHASCSSACSGSCSRSLPSAIYPFYEHHPHYWGLTPREDQNTGRAGDGARAVDRDGHRARLPVREDAHRVRARGRSAQERFEVALKRRATRREAGRTTG